MKLPRKLKKQVKNAVLIYDIASIPTGMTMENVMDVFKNEGVVVWCSGVQYNMSKTNQPTPPIILGRHSKIKVIDRKTITGK